MDVEPNYESEDDAIELALLRRNDPGDTFACIRLRVCSDETLSQALQSNDHVNSITFCFYDIGTTTNWDLLLRVLATRENLESVYLDDLQRNPSDRVKPFLHALQQNPRVKDMKLHKLQLSGDSFASYLDNATSVTTLQMEECHMEAPDGALGIADALQRNMNIQQLTLAGLAETDLIPIVTSLAANTSVREL